MQKEDLGEGHGQSFRYLCAACSRTSIVKLSMSLVPSPHGLVWKGSTSVDHTHECAKIKFASVDV